MIGELIEAIATLGLGSDFAVPAHLSRKVHVEQHKVDVHALPLTEALRLYKELDQIFGG